MAAHSLAHINELRAVAGVASNFGKIAAEKRDILGAVAPRAEDNDLMVPVAPAAASSGGDPSAVSSSAIVSRARHVSQLVRPKPDVPMVRTSTETDADMADIPDETPTGIVSVEIPRKPTGRMKVTAQTLQEIDDAAVLRMFSSNAPMLRNAGNTLVQFCLAWDETRRDRVRIAANGGDATVGLATETMITPDTRSTSGRAGGNLSTAAAPPAPAAAATPTLAAPPAITSRKPAARASRSSKSSTGAPGRVVPSDISDRYPTDTMPLFSTIPIVPPKTPSIQAAEDRLAESASEPNAKRSRQPSTTPTTMPMAPSVGGGGSFAEPSRRALELHIDKAAIPRHLLPLSASFTVAEVTRAAVTSFGAIPSELKTPRPVLVRWCTIQERAYVQAVTEEQECILKAACVGIQLRHPDSRPFIFRRWRISDDPAVVEGRTATGYASQMCYACILRTLCFRKNYERGTKGLQLPVSSPFSYLIEVPGEYMQSAFMPVDATGDTDVRPVRNLCITDLVPSYIVEGAAVRFRFVERSELRYCDGSQLSAALPLVNPSSYIDFEIAPYTQERQLLIYFFRDIANLYMRTLGREMPECLKILRIILLPIEQGIKLLEDESFRAQHLPADLLASTRYVSDKFDLINQLRLDETRTPPFEGHLVYWLLHIRMNFTLWLIAEGLDAIKRDLAAGANALMKRKRSDMPPPPPPPQHARGSNVTGASEPLPEQLCVPPAPAAREWIRGNEVESSLASEIEGKRAQLVRFVKAHAAMVKHIGEQLVLLDTTGRIDDEALLAPDVFAVIKPEPSYIGPFFPEDRSRIEYISRPHIVHRAGCAQLIYALLGTWCFAEKNPAGAHHPGDHLAASSIPDRDIAVLCIDGGATPVRWKTSRAAECVPSNFSRLSLYLGETLVVPPEYILGEFRATHWWISRDAPKEFVTCQFPAMVAAGMFQTWNYGRYHPKAAAALANGTWRSGTSTTSAAAAASAAQDNDKSYTVLAALLLRIHVISGLLQSLQSIYNLRSESLDPKVFAPLDEQIFGVFEDIARRKPEEVFDALPNPEYTRCAPTSVYQVLESQRSLQECIYLLHKLLCSHLPLAYAMVVNCSAREGAGPTDAVLYDISRSNTNTALDAPTRPSLYELYYPRDDLVMCEDNLVDCSSRESLLRFISERSGNEPLLEVQEKALPARCHPRDLEKRIREMVGNNSASARYYAQTVYCTLLGGYRTARVRPRFAKLLQLYGAFQDPSKPDGLSVDIESLCTGCRFLSVSTIRENTMMHIRHNLGFLAAVQLRFKEGGKDYDDFDRVWLRNCTDEVRRMFDMGMSLGNISAAVKDSQGRTKPFVYRRTRTDVLKEIWNRLRNLYCSRVVAEYMHDDQFQWPDLLVIERDDLRDLFELVCKFDPHAEGFDYGEILEEHLDIDHAAVLAIKSVESDFLQNGCIGDHIDAHLADTLNEEQLLISMAFFYMLRAHVAVRTVPLDSGQRTLQELAVGRRTGIAVGDPLPDGAHVIYFCSVLGCHKCKTPMVQDFGMSRIGNSDVSFDIEHNRPVCRPRKTSKGGYSLAARRQRDKRASAGKAGPADRDPDGDVRASSYLDAKTISRARRDFIDACMKRDHKSDELLLSGARTRETLLSDAKVMRCIDAVKKARAEVAKAAYKEANQRSKTMFNLPCEDGVMTSYDLLGQVVERSVGKDKLECFTLCTSCGCPSVFSTSMISTNGFTCGVCDRRLRADLHRPSCIGCARMYLTTEVDKRSKKRDASSAEAQMSATQVGVMAAPQTAGGLRVVSVSEQQRRILPGPPMTVEQSAAETASAAAASATHSTPSTGVRRTGKRSKGAAAAANDIVGPVVVKAASSSTKDAELVKRRSTRGGRSPDFAGAEEWFSYNLLDSDLYEMRTVYVCGLCNYDRPWLRRLEPMCTVQDFVLFIKRCVTRQEEAMRRLHVGVYAEEENQTQAYISEDVAATMDTAAKAQHAAELATRAVDATEAEADEAVPVPVASSAPQPQQQSKHKGGARNKKKKSKQMSVRQTLEMKMKDMSRRPM